jgi:hypothetical protein
MRLLWKQTALQSLIKLDVWCEENDWPAIAEHPVDFIESYFYKQDMSVLSSRQGRFG